MNLQKLSIPSDLLKQTRTTDNLSDRATLALQEIMAVIVESPHNATLRSMVTRFRTALDSYTDGIDNSPAEAARVFGAEIDTLIREISLNRALRSSLQKARPYLARDLP